jgi:hypothetical protein
MLAVETSEDLLKDRTGRVAFNLHWEASLSALLDRALVAESRTRGQLPGASGRMLRTTSEWKCTWIDNTNSYSVMSSH